MEAHHGGEDFAEAFTGFSYDAQGAGGVLRPFRGILGGSVKG
ncbi:hypothetical protein [Streptomyces sp. NPDC019937]